MDQFMFCKTNIIFCGPIGRVNEENKKVYQKVNVNQQRRDLIEFQRVYRSSRSTEVCTFFFFLSRFFFKQNTSIWSRTRFARDLLMAAFFSLSSLLFACVECNSHLISIELIECKQLQGTQQMVNGMRMTYTVESSLSSHFRLLHQFDAIFDQLKTT